jgi:hypothetical protein
MMPSLRYSILALVSLVSLGLSSCVQSTSPPTGPGDDPLLVIPNDAPTNESACEDRLSFARQTIEDVIARGNGECTQDSECALVWVDTQCQGACQAAILSSRVDDFERAKLAIDERACTGYMQDGCSYSTPRCMQMQAICAEDHCTMTPVAG